MSTRKEILLQGGEGSRYWVLGDLYLFKATGRETGGAFALIEQEIQPQGGPPPHIHHAEEEAFFVLEGRFSFQCGDREEILEKGAFAYIPKGTLHTFRNLESTRGRLLVSIIPGGFEEIFFEIGTPAEDLSSPPAPDAESLERILQLAEKYHLEVVLPQG